VRRELCLAAALILSSCTILSVRKFDHDFEGLNAAVLRAHSAGGTLRILIVHGMGHHDPGYSRPLLSGVATRLGLSGSSASPRIYIEKESHFYGEVNIDEYANGDGKKVRVYELTWSPTTDALKKKQFATDATYAGDRVAVNRKLKADLVDDALADPVLYIGRYRNHMQFPIMRAVEAVLHDFQSQDEVAIITQSLGSYMTYDTLLKMSRGERIMGERDYSAALVDEVIGHTNYVFMLANQLPLLELSEVTNPLSLKKSSAAALRAIGQIRLQNKPRTLAQRQQTPLSLRLVAFTDPNDLLSYPLDANDVSSDSVAYSNVVISVERTAILGAFAWPMTAHTGHDKSKAVMDLLAFGHKGR